MSEDKRRKLTDALQTIKEECKEHTLCEECPFGSKYGECLLTSYQPNKWAITKPQKIWRAFSFESQED